MFTIPEDIVHKELLSNEVSVIPIKDLLTFQDGMSLKIAPHLSTAAWEPSHFEKMKVDPALNVFSKATHGTARKLPSVLLDYSLAPGAN